MPIESASWKITARANRRLLAVCLAAYLAIGTLGVTRALAQPVCNRIAQGTQFGPHELCAYTVLKPQGQNRYEPKMAADDNLATAWVEGAPGSGAGQWIEYVFTTPSKAQTLNIVNGYAKSKASFRNNERIRSFRIEVDDRTVHTGRLADTSRRQTIRLREPVRGTIWRLHVVDTYPGAKWKDLAVTEFWIDLEEHNYE